MLTKRSAALATMLIGVAGGPCLAATCNLTIQGAHVLDDENCTVASGKDFTKVLAEDGSRIEIRRSVMRARFAEAQPASGRRPKLTSLGDVVTSDNSDNRTCFFGQKAVLCIEQ